MAPRVLTLIHVQVIYMMDYYGWREGTLISLWVTVVSASITLFLSSMHLFQISVYNIALLYNMLALCFSAGLWGSLQFSSLQRQHPRAVLLMERLLFALMPATPPVILTWAAIAVAGSSAAPWFVVAFFGIGLVLYVLPCRSSFRCKHTPPHLPSS